MSHEITSLSVKNFKGVQGEITLKPEGALVVIAGANGSGKSSFIDAIVEIFDPKGTRLTTRPIHDGETEASAEVVTTEVRLVRTWKKNDAGTLNAYALDGAKYSSGRDFVLKATGGALFDPDAFLKLDEKAQRQQLLERVELPFDLEEIDNRRRGIFDARTEVGREVARLEGQLSGFGPVDVTVPLTETSAAELAAEHAAGVAHNMSLVRDVDLAAERDRHIEALDATIARLKDQLLLAEQDRITAVDDREQLRGRIEQAVPVDVDAIGQRLATVEETNAKVRAQAQRSAVAAELKSKAAEQSALTEQLAAIDEQKATGLAGAAFPVAGLSVDEDGITFEGVPFKQVNTAMRTAIAFNLATLGRPALRLIVIKDGDSLDSDSLASVAAIAEERGYIVLVERDRDESREIGFTIEHGTLADS